MHSWRYICEHMGAEYPLNANKGGKIEYLKLHIDLKMDVWYRNTIIADCSCMAAVRTALLFHHLILMFLCLHLLVTLSAGCGVSASNIKHCTCFRNAIWEIYKEKQKCFLRGTVIPTVWDSPKILVNSAKIVQEFKFVMSPSMHAPTMHLGHGTIFFWNTFIHWWI